MTMSGAFYNEIDPQAAAWLRELIAQGLIAPGVVDERDIQDISPADLRGFSQVHLFAGIGVWSYSLRRAGWPDDRPVWTASCPCQPFSSAGKGAGFDDERHLWPAVDWLVQQCQPECILGEQVASKDAEPWLDLVQADLEGLGYAFGACAFPSAGVGAPHIRDRTYWVAYSDRGIGREGHQDDRGWFDRGHAQSWARSSGSGVPHNVADTYGEHERPAGDAARDRELGRRGEVVGVDLAGSTRLEGQRSGHKAKVGQREGSVRPVAETGQSDGMGNTKGERAADQRIGDGEASQRASQQLGAISGAASRTGLGHASERSRDDAGRSAGPAGLERRNERPGPTNGLWGDADWLFCRDGKWRPVEPGTFPLAHGAPSRVRRGSDPSAPVDTASGEARVMRLRGYGNAINAEAAINFITAYQEASSALR